LEKPRPEQVFSHWVSAGILALDPRALAVIPRVGAPDFGRDVFPALLEHDAPVYGYRMAADEHLWWIDTAADLERVVTALATPGEAMSHAD
jgi:NDP-sugar pyrophosphorylase family protein